MDIKGKIKFFMVLNLCLFSLGCSVPVNVYIRNLSMEPQKIIVQYNTAPQKDEVLFYYKDGIEEPIFGMSKQFTESIKAQQTGNVYELSLPPETTMIIECSINFHSLMYKSISIGDKDLLSQEGMYEQQVFTSKRESLTKYSLWFDVK